jgi:pimeloyl-ACP methyl ester carboxylesterase
MPFLDTTDGVSLFYNDWGTNKQNGAKPIVLIHGWPLNADMWEYQAGFLAEHGHRVITYDRRGFGRSGQPWTGYDYDTLAADLNSVLETLHVQDAMVVGFSMGGGELARYLTRYGSARVSRAVLLSAVTPYMLKTPDHQDGVEPAVFEHMLAGLRADRPHFLANFGRSFFGAGLLNFSISSEILNWSLGMALQGSLHATLECARSFSQTDFRPDMASFTMPTLVIHGDADQTVPIDVSAKATVALIPHAELREYAAAPHATFFVEKDRLNQDLLNFAR